MLALRVMLDNKHFSTLHGQRMSDYPCSARNEASTKTATVDIIMALHSAVRLREVNDFGIW
eukprot:scaffold254892_cov15-Prasinocladus_malaysianus.AAC.1